MIILRGFLSAAMRFLMAGKIMCARFFDGKMLREKRQATLYYTTYKSALVCCDLLLYLGEGIRLLINEYLLGGLNLIVAAGEHLFEY